MADYIEVDTAALERDRQTIQSELDRSAVRLAVSETRWPASHPCGRGRRTIHLWHSLMRIMNLYSSLEMKSEHT